MNQTGKNNQVTTLSEPQTRLIFEPLSSPSPFSMTFTWKSDVIKVEIEKGEDVLKLAQIFSDFLTSNDIPNKIIKG